MQTNRLDFPTACLLHSENESAALVNLLLLYARAWSVFLPVFSVRTSSFRFDICSHGSVQPRIRRRLVSGFLCGSLYAPSKSLTVGQLINSYCS
jgi:hypothetical protein